MKNTIRNTKRITVILVLYSVFCILLLGLFFTPEAANAATYYVDDANGSDTNNGLSWAQSKKTISAALTTAGNGPASIYVKNGSYAKLTDNTTRTDWVKIIAAEGHQPDVNGLTLGVYGQNPTRNVYLWFEGLDFPKTNSNIYYVNYLKFIDCNFTAATLSFDGAYWPWYVQGNYVLLNFVYCSYGTIQNCKFAHSYRAIGITGVGTDWLIDNCICDQMCEHFIKTNMHNLTVSNCTADGFGWGGCEGGTELCMNGPDNAIGTFEAGEVIVQDTTGAQGIYTRSIPNTKYVYLYQTTQSDFLIGYKMTGQDSGAYITPTERHPVKGMAMYVAEGNNVQIINNKIHTNSRCIAFYSDVGNGIKNLLFENNLCYGVYPGSFIQWCPMVGVNIINNTIIVPTGFVNLTGNAGYGPQQSNIIDNMYNNVFTSLRQFNDSGSLYIRVINHGNNIFGNDPGGADSHGGPAYPFVPNYTELVNYNINSLFMDVANNDFNLAPNSSAIDFGNPDYGPKTDILGNPRDALPDVGCYEYGASTLVYGDVNSDGEISAYDAALTAQAAVDLITLTADQTKAADVSGDGEVTAYDAALIAQRAVGLIDKFPVE